MFPDKRVTDTLKGSGAIMELEEQLLIITCVKAEGWQEDKIRRQIYVSAETTVFKCPPR